MSEHATLSAPIRDCEPNRDWIRPIALRRVILDNNLVLAPMAGVSNLPFRLIAKEAGAALVFTETISAKGLVLGGEKTWRMLRSAPQEKPVAYQLFGRDPEILGEACRRLEAHGAEWIDLNVGCPVKKFILNGAGAALLKDPELVAQIVEKMRAAFSGTLSVKIRVGWDESTLTGVRIARLAVDAGAELIAVHGRTRAQQYRGKASRARIREVVEAVPEVPVLANGDIETPDDVFAMLAETGAAGVMIGRGSLGNPWLFRETLERAGQIPPRPRDAIATWDLIEHHIELMAKYFPDEQALVHNLKKYIVAYAKGCHGATAFRDRVQRSEELSGLLQLARDFFRPRQVA